MLSPHFVQKKSLLTCIPPSDSNPCTVDLHSCLSDSSVAILPCVLSAIIWVMPFEILRTKLPFRRLSSETDCHSVMAKIAVVESCTTRSQNLKGWTCCLLDDVPFYSHVSFWAVLQLFLADLAMHQRFLWAGDGEGSSPQFDDIMERLRSRLNHQKTWLDAKALRVANTVSTVNSALCLKADACFHLDRLHLNEVLSFECATERFPSFRRGRPWSKLQRSPASRNT